ncbi:MAG TPA: hypothetical protein VJP85_03560 [Candidatus Baltobacteraceae bacterium]|nr:hypothetical protein [Candidatus Baltobacteraceae bacterium]
MTEDELAAVAAAIGALTQQPEEPPQPVSAWKRQARMESAGVQ